VRRFKIRVFEQGGAWFFRWDNIDVPTVCYVTPPLASKEQAESKKDAFMEAEKQKNGMVAFESE
jgi:hypothetical protein